MDNEKNLITIHRQYVGALISTHGIKVLGSNLQGDWGLFVGSLRVLLMPACVLFVSSGFLPQLCRLGQLANKLPNDVNKYERLVVSPVIVWGLVQGVLCFSPIVTLGLPTLKKKIENGNSKSRLPRTCPLV